MREHEKDDSGEWVEVRTDHANGVSPLYHVGRTIAVNCPACGALVRHKRLLGFAGNYPLDAGSDGSAS